MTSSTSRKQGKGALPLSPAPQSPNRAFAPLRTLSVDDGEHFLHNHPASVASLRLLFTFTPECCSPSLRNGCSPSPEYPMFHQLSRSHPEQQYNLVSKAGRLRGVKWDIALTYGFSDF